MSKTTPTTTITVHSRAEAAAVVPVMLGFHPAESVIIMGVGTGSPTARLNLTGAKGPELRQALMPALQAGHWREGCAVAIFTDEDLNCADILLSSIPTWLPGVPIIDAFRVTEGQCFGAWDVVGVSVAEVPRVTGQIAASRDDLVPDVQQLQEPDEVLSRAIAAYKSGSGAAAWILLEHLEELLGEAALPERAQRLVALLHAAVNPRGVDV